MVLNASKKVEVILNNQGIPKESDLESDKNNDVNPELITYIQGLISKHNKSAPGMKDIILKHANPVVMKDNLNFYYLTSATDSKVLAHLQRLMENAKNSESHKSLLGKLNEVIKSRSQSTPKDTN